MEKVMETADFFEQGIVIADGTMCDTGNINWKIHPSFQGVFMKTVLRGCDTGGRLSCHMIKIEPGREIGIHAHDGRMELHEVIAGCGKCTIGDKMVAYRPGVISCIPDDINHGIAAGDKGLLLFAKFFPALE